MSGETQKKDGVEVLCRQEKYFATAGTARALTMYHSILDRYGKFASFLAVSSREEFHSDCTWHGTTTTSRMPAATSLPLSFDSIALVPGEEPPPRILSILAQARRSVQRRNRRREAVHIGIEGPFHEAFLPVGAQSLCLLCALC